MPRRWKRWLWLLLLLFVVGGCLLAYLHYSSEKFGDRENERWRFALRSDRRLDGLDKTGLVDVRLWEDRFRVLMDALTVDDGHGDDHGLHHRTKPEREAELWSHLKSIPSYPGAPEMLLAAIDDVYFGYHGNGWWGYWWHWPYFNCFKVLELADRLEGAAPAFEEEALWTKIYCYRVKGWSEGEGSTPGPEDRSQEAWRSDAAKVAILCRQLQQSFPKGKYASKAAALLAEKNVLLDLPRYPVMGRVWTDGTGRSYSMKRYEGPEFVIERIR